jgi:hypothetical protein
MIITRVLRIGNVAKKDIIQSIKDKEMDRKEFLKYSGLALAALVGFRAVISFLTQPEQRKVIVEKNDSTGRGFGSGKYGA